MRSFARRGIVLSRRPRGYRQRWPGERRPLAIPDQTNAPEQERVEGDRGEHAPGKRGSFAGDANHELRVQPRVVLESNYAQRWTLTLYLSVGEKVQRSCDRSEKGAARKNSYCDRSERSAFQTDDAITCLGDFLEKSRRETAAEAKDREVFTAQTVFVKRHQAEHVEPILAAERQHRRGGIVLRIGLDENAHTAAFRRGHIDEGFEDVRFGDDADQAVFLQDRQRADAIAAKRPRRFFDGAIESRGDHFLSHHGGDRPGHRIFHYFD